MVFNSTSLQPNLQPNLLVMKFGGTSMGSAARIRIAAQLAAEQYRERPLVVVVSAMSKITDLLLDTLRKAEAGDEGDLEANLAQLAERHAETCRAKLASKSPSSPASALRRV